MKFGFFFWPYTAEYTTRMASLGESLGWDLVGIADTPGNAMDVWVALGQAAACTERVGLASCVTNLVTRHPSITSGAALSIESLSNGRFILGLGTGHSGVVNVGDAPSRPAAFRDGVALMRASLMHRVPVYAAGSGPSALAIGGAVADGVFVNYGLERVQVERARAHIAEGARDAGRQGAASDTWWIACLDVASRREESFEKLGNILGFVAAYVVGPAPENRDVPAELVPAMRELRHTYTTRRSEMDPGLTKRLGIFDYLRRRLAIAGTPEDCIEQVRAARAAGATQLMFTVSLAADPLRAVELFGREVLPVVRRDG